MPSWRDKAYPIPDDIDPGQNRCIRIYVPDNPVYLGDFWLAYEFFTSWLAWPKGGTTAKQVAAIWKAAFDQAREEYELGEGCDNMDVRQKPDDPCILQKYGGGIWVDFADMSLCRDALTTPPIYTENQGDRTPQGATLDDILYWIKTIIEQTIIDIDGDIEPPVVKGNLTGQIGGQTGTNAGPGVAQLVDALTEHTEQERHDARDSFPWSDLRHDGLCATMDFDVVTDLANWLNALSEYLVETLNASSDWLVYALSTLAEALGGQGGNGLLRAGWAAGGGGVGFGFEGDPIDCGTWTSTLDFTVDDYGWDALGGYAEYEPGVGWHNTADNENCWIIYYPHSTTRIFSLEGTWEASCPYSVWQGAVVALDDTHFTRNDALANTGGTLLVSLAEGVTAWIKHQVTIIRVPGAQPKVTITQAVVTGTGARPAGWPAS